MAQIINTLYNGDNKGGGDGDGGGVGDDDGGGGDDDDDGNNNIKLSEACLSFSVAPFVG